jgi:hypothetical protein
MPEPSVKKSAAGRTSQCARRNSCQVVRFSTEPTREIAVDWPLTTQPHSDEQVGTQVKSRHPQVLTQQHSDTCWQLRTTEPNACDSDS